VSNKRFLLVYKLNIPERPTPNTRAEEDIGQRYLMKPSLSNSRCFHLGLSLCSTVCIG